MNMTTLNDEETPKKIFFPHMTVIDKNDRSKKHEKLKQDLNYQNKNLNSIFLWAVKKNSQTQPTTKPQKAYQL